MLISFRGAHGQILLSFNQANFYPWFQTSAWAKRSGLEMWEWFWSLGEKGNKWIYQYVKHISLRAFLLYKLRAKMWTLHTTYPIIYLMLLSKNTLLGWRGGVNDFVPTDIGAFIAPGKLYFLSGVQQVTLHGKQNCQRALQSAAHTHSVRCYENCSLSQTTMSKHSAVIELHLNLKKNKKNKTNPLCFCRLGCD